VEALAEALDRIENTFLSVVLPCLAEYAVEPGVDDEPATNVAVLESDLKLPVGHVAEWTPADILFVIPLSVSYSSAEASELPTSTSSSGILIPGEGLHRNPTNNLKHLAVLLLPVEAASDADYRNLS
jgi:hypothetical protein